MPGIGPNNTSLLHKQLKLAAWEMTDEQLLLIVEKEQTRRTFQRAMGRIIRSNKDKPPSRPKLTLEQLGLAPAICEMLRAKGTDEATLIRQIQKAGLL